MKLKINKNYKSKEERTNLKKNIDKLGLKTNKIFTKESRTKFKNKKNKNQS
jgi:hypothetical protein